MWKASRSGILESRRLEPVKVSEADIEQAPRSLWRRSLKSNFTSAPKTWPSELQAVMAEKRGRVPTLLALFMVPRHGPG